jgi:transcriptional regulator with XRE-family HTH domain
MTTEKQPIMDDYREDAATFGDRLALAREAQNLTAEQLSRRLGLRTETMRNWEADRSAPRANRLQMLAGFLNVSIVWLLTGEGEGAPIVRKDPALGQSSGGSAEAQALLAEIRDIRLINAKATDRLSKLEKRLRAYLAPA